MAMADTNEPTTVAPNHLSGFQRDILYVISGLNEPHGLGIKEKLEGLYDEQRVNHGRLYPNLDKLADKDLIEKGEIDKRTNSYKLTRKGQQFVEEHHKWRQTRL